MVMIATTQVISALAATVQRTESLTDQDLDAIFDFMVAQYDWPFIRWFCRDDGAQWERFRAAHPHATGREFCDEIWRTIPADVEAHMRAHVQRVGRLPKPRIGGVR